MAKRGIFTKFRSCDLKERLGEERARFAARDIAKLNGYRNGVIGYYACRFGAHFHVGKKPIWKAIEEENSGLEQIDEPKVDVPADISLAGLEQVAEALRNHGVPNQED